MKSRYIAKWFPCPTACGLYMWNVYYQTENTYPVAGGWRNTIGQAKREALAAKKRMEQADENEVD